MTHRIRALCVCLGVAVVSAAGAVAALRAQPREARITIPYLANASAPADLDYAAAQCDVASDDQTMTCHFRQVFITPTSIEPTSCAITTNGYSKVFRRVSPVRWTSTDEPMGECGVSETTTLEDGGGTRWTMHIAARATRNVERSDCQAAAAEETYDWKMVKRRLPCVTIQPGAIER